MSDTATAAIARIEGGAVASARAATQAKEQVIRKPPIAAEPSRDLSFEVDAPARRITVHVIDRETKSVVRSFPLVMPGAGNDDAPPYRGALVDAKA